MVSTPVCEELKAGRKPILFIVVSYEIGPFVLCFFWIITSMCRNYDIGFWVPLGGVVQICAKSLIVTDTYITRENKIPAQTCCVPLQTPLNCDSKPWVTTISYCCM